MLTLYLGTDPDRTHSLADLNALIKEYARVGIYSKADFREFYRQLEVPRHFQVPR